MNILIIKLGATGDVVRTTTLLRRFQADEVTWITAKKNITMIQGLDKEIRCLPWEQREVARDRDYDLLINLEDTVDVGTFAATVRQSQTFGAYLGAGGMLEYTEDSQGWFDLSLISRFGDVRADELKLQNRRTYQDLIFSGLGLNFDGAQYLVPVAADTGLVGDIAISPVAGPVWPMKAWAFYTSLQSELEARGFKVNVLPTRATLLEHLGDVQGHRCLISGDSLPMHLALGSGVKCVSIFTCTSPWEIYDYGIQVKMISPLLAEFFYKRNFDERATSAISVEEVLAAVLRQLN